MSTDSRWRIKEFSAIVEVSEATLRAWERRYGLLDPERSSGGFRLYSAVDEMRIRAMQAHMADGISPAQAAALAIAETAGQARPSGTPRRPRRAAHRRRSGLRRDDLRPAPRCRLLVRATGGDPRRRAARARRDRRALGARGDGDRPRALLQPPHRAPAAVARAGLGGGQRAARRARLPRGGAPHARPRVLRPDARRSGLADRLPRGRHADRGDRRPERFDGRRRGRAVRARQRVPHGQRRRHPRARPSAAHDRRRRGRVGRDRAAPLRAPRRGRPRGYRAAPRRASHAGAVAPGRVVVGGPS